jgi:hypothetical protein
MTGQLDTTETTPAGARNMPFVATLNPTSAGSPLRCNQDGGPVLRRVLSMSSIGLSIQEIDSITIFCDPPWGFRIAY